MLSNENYTLAFLRESASEMRDQIDNLRKYGFFDQRLKKRYDDTLDQIRIIVRNQAMRESDTNQRYLRSKRKLQFTKDSGNQLGRSQCCSTSSFFYDDELPTVLTEEEVTQSKEEVTQPVQQSRK